MHPLGKLGDLRQALPRVFAPEDMDGREGELVAVRLTEGDAAEGAASSHQSGGQRLWRQRKGGCLFGSHL
jgi:hypothetical protein